ncbi:dynein axonemal intermediate chain 4-like [Frankliniella occidentalis]|uniref:Dynein axonemal intermediate chain 4 n=1 Tax=Frankliniella occidentalis TaxID=133901 RepID=A0A9C6UA03_FRAOC|nr:dynein axonemal intermediate chain 4-like [Frankliniella occidentalis]
MGSIIRATYRPGDLLRENVRIFDENDVDVTPLPLVFNGFDDEEDEEEDAIVDLTFQDTEQVVRTTTESYIAALPEDRTPTPSSGAGASAAGSGHRTEGSSQGGGEDGGEEDAEEGDIDDTASTPPPRIPTPILQALQAIRHYKPAPEPRTTYFLAETPTFWLFELPSKCLPWNGPDAGDEAAQSRREDGHYFWLTYAEGRLRHRHDAEAQTPVTLTKKQRTQTLAVHSSTVQLFATEWDLYDTFRKVNIASRLAGRGPARSNAIVPKGEATTAHSARSIGVSTTTAADDAARARNGWARLAAATAREAASRTTIIRIGEQPVSPRRRLLRSSQDLLESREFRLAATICERLLASNSYRRRQEIFIGHPRLLTRQKPSEFRYTVTRLFELYNQDTQGLPVTGVAWNGKDNTILAAGYGCYLLSDSSRTGLVCCWSIKNPFQPERIYRLDSAVTALNFSSERPNLLAVGVQSGLVYIVDVSLYASDPRAVRQLRSDKAPMAYAPLWDVQWFTYTDFVASTEEVLTVGDDGWVCKWNLDRDWESYPLCRVQYYPEREDLLRRADPAACEVRVLSALCVTLLPGTRYLVATKDGVVAECHVHQRASRPTLTTAHAGPIYAIRRSPFCGNLYLTAGADWTACLWLRGWDEPLVKLNSPQNAAVEAAAWSPSHATLIATVSGRELQVWDVGRRAASARPVAVVPNERSVRYTRVDWARDGLSLLSGDRAGHVWVHHLGELPHRPRLAREALVAALSPLVPPHRRPLLREKLLSDD